MMISMRCPHCGRTISDAVILREAGGIAGRKTAARGSDYFRRIAAQRKSFRGGRPRKDSTQQKSSQPTRSAAEADEGIDRADSPNTGSRPTIRTVNPKKTIR